MLTVYIIRVVSAPAWKCFAVEISFPLRWKNAKIPSREKNQNEKQEVMIMNKHERHIAIGGN